MKIRTIGQLYNEYKKHYDKLDSVSKNKGCVVALIDGEWGEHTFNLIESGNVQKIDGDNTLNINVAPNGENYKIDDTGTPRRIYTHAKFLKVLASAVHKFGANTEVTLVGGWIYDVFTINKEFFDRFEEEGPYEAIYHMMGIKVDLDTLRVTQPLSKNASSGAPVPGAKSDLYTSQNELDITNKKMSKYKTLKKKSEIAGNMYKNRTDYAKTQAPIVEVDVICLSFTEVKHPEDMYNAD